MGATRSYVGDNATIDDAGQIDITSNVAGSTADADIVVGTGAAISIGLSKAVASSWPGSEAYIGENVTIGQDLPIGSINIKATGRGEADASAKASGGGVVQVGISNAVADYDPAVTASIGSGTTIVATGDVLVEAFLDDQPVGAPPSDHIQGINANDDTIGFSYPVSTGDVVQYQNQSGGSDIGGLENNRTYNVLAENNGAIIKLGNLFDAGAAVDEAANVIIFESFHNFQNGDAVFYDSNGGVSIIESWQNIDPAVDLLYVRLIQVGEDNGEPIYDKYKIRLTDSLNDALRTDDQLLQTIQSGAIDSSTDTLTMATSGDFKEGDIVTYLADDVEEFNGDLVDITEASQSTEVLGPDGNALDPKRFSNDVKRNFNDPASDNYLDIIHNSGSNNIYIEAHGYQDGDAVVYRNNGSSPDIANLNDGDTYRIIWQSSNAVQLTKTYAQIDLSMVSNIDSNDASKGSKVTLNSHGFQNGDRLTDLDTSSVYYVIGASGSEFSLSKTQGAVPLPFPVH